MSEVGDRQVRELERRIDILERPENQGDGFQLSDWVSLLVVGVLVPIILFIWGWF